MKQLKKIVSSVVLFAFTVLMWVPIYYFVIGAFKKRTDIVKHPLVINLKMFTTENFSYTIKKMKLFSALGNTAFITVLALVLIIIAGSLAGFAIARIKGKLFNIYYGAVVSLMVIPFIGALIPLISLIKDLGLYNNLWGCVLIQAAWNLPFAIFLFTGFMRGIPKELEEAAYIDGCSTVGIYWRMFLPLLKPVIATCCIRSGIGIWNDYLVTNTLLNSVKMPTLMVAIYQFFGQYVSEYGYAFAGIIMASLPVIVAFIFLQKYFIKGLTAGAVKG